MFPRIPKIIDGKYDTTGIESVRKHQLRRNIRFQLGEQKVFFVKKRTTVADVPADKLARKLRRQRGPRRDKVEKDTESARTRVRRKWVEAGVTKERSEQEEREKVSTVTSGDGSCSNDGLPTARPRPLIPMYLVHGAGMETTKKL